MKEQQPNIWETFEDTRPPLTLTHDYLYEYRGIWSNDARAHIQVYEGARPPVVIATEPTDNPGTSVTNAIELLGAELLLAHFPTRQYEAIPMRFVEHYPERTNGRETVAETFDSVRFPMWRPKDVLVGGVWRKSLGEPQWESIDRVQVERWIGGPIRRGK